MKLKAILATAAALGSVAQGETSIKQVASKKKTVKTIDRILAQVDNYVAHLNGIKSRLIDTIEYKQENGPLLAVTSKNEVLYGNLMKNEFESKAAEGMKYAVYGKNGRIWGINAKRQICYLDTKEEGSDWVIFNQGNRWNWIALYGNALLAPIQNGGISYFPNVEAPGTHHTLDGSFGTLSWDGHHMCGAKLDKGSCWCRPFDGDFEEYDTTKWIKVAREGVEDCVPNGDRVIAVKKVKGYLRTQASPIKPGSTEWVDISGQGTQGPYIGALVANGKFTAGIGARSTLFYDEQNTQGRFGIPTSVRPVEGFLKLAVTDQQLLTMNANKIVTAPLQKGPLVALSIEDKDVVYGNLDNKKFRHGGAFGSQFAAFGPNGILWGVDQSGNIHSLDTKVKDPWQAPKQFASGNYTRVAPHLQGLLALDTEDKIFYFPDLANADERREIAGRLRTISWDGSFMCGVSAISECFCSPFEGSEFVGWGRMNGDGLDCFPFGSHTLVHKKGTLDVIAKPYSGKGPEIKVIPASESGQYKHVSVSGNYLVGINSNDDLHFVKQKGGRFGVSQVVRKLSGSSAIAIYDSATEEGYEKLAASHNFLQAPTQPAKVNVSSQAGGLVAVTGAGKDMVYGNLETKKFGNGGAFGQKFAAFGPNGMLWGIDQSGNIASLDTKAKDIWQKPKQFASGNYTRLAPHIHGLLALDTEDKITYFPDITNAAKQKPIPGRLRTISWDGSFMCGVNAHSDCFCSHMEGTKGMGIWVHLNGGARDCFPFGTHTLVHKKGTLDVIAKPYSGQGPEIKVTPAGPSGKYQHVSVSGNYLAGTKANGDLHFVKQKGGKFGVSQSVRKVVGSTTVAVYDSATEQGYAKLAATHNSLPQYTLVNVSSQAGGLVAVPNKAGNVVYGNLESRQFGFAGPFGSKFAVFGPGAKLWGVDDAGSISFLDTWVHNPWQPPTHFASGNFTRVAPHLKGLVALDKEDKITYFPDLANAKDRRELPGRLKTISWDGSFMCGVNAYSECFCTHFEGSKLAGWVLLSKGGLDCFPFGTHTLVHKKKTLDVTAKPYSGRGPETKVTPAGPSGQYKHVSVSGNYLAGIKANGDLHFVKQNGGKFGVSKSVRKVAGSTTIGVYDSATEQGNTKLAATHNLLPAYTTMNVSSKAGGLVSVTTNARDVVYGNLESGQFGYGGPFFSKFAVFGPGGKLWGVDGAGNINVLDTKTGNPWQAATHFAAGKYTRVAPHLKGLVALDNEDKITYFPDLANADERRELPGHLRTISWDGSFICGVNAYSECFCTHFDGAKLASWVLLNKGGLDCFPFGTHTLVHKKDTLDVIARPYSGRGPETKVTPAGPSGQYKHVSVSGNYLAGIKANGNLHFVKQSGGKFGASQSVRKVTGSTTVGVYDSATEQGYTKLAATHNLLPTFTTVNVSSKAGGLVSVSTKTRDVLYGNLESGLFGYGGGAGSKFAVFGPSGRLWGVDDAGSIHVLHTNTNDPWQPWTLFTSGQFTRVAAHHKGLLAIDTEDKITFFWDITNASQRREIPGRLKTISWDGSFMCGVNAYSDCYCSHFEGSTFGGWARMNGNGLDCFPFGSHTLVHKKDTLDVIAKPYSGKGPEIKVTPAGPSGRFKYVSVSGNYLVGIKANDDLHVVKQHGGKFGVSKSVRKVIGGASAIGVYDSATEEGYVKLSLTHTQLVAA